MVRRFAPLLLAGSLAAAPAAAAPDRETRWPLDPASLGGAGIFTAAESHVAAAARAAACAFEADPRPLPPQVILTLDTPDGAVARSGGVLLWRGEMLPDQLAPGETGTLVRKRPAPGGGWKSVRTRQNYVPGASTNMVPVVRTHAGFALPAMIIETPYHLGTLAGAPVRLVLWRTAAEDSAPLGGFLDVPGNSPAFLEALKSRLVPFEAQADWAAEFDALAR